MNWSVKFMDHHNSGWNVLEKGKWCENCSFHKERNFLLKKHNDEEIVQQNVSCLALFILLFV